MKDNNKIVMLPRDLLHPHPDNPRKDLGDLTELKESIREHGIMQNLTVVPDDEDGYQILIGHRRFAASEGILDDLPCVVAKGLSNREQVGIMLCENMQRSDLTYIEQAHGFQMMLDLGDTVETISKKTGFSKTTIKHRLAINEIDSESLKSALEYFQPTLQDFILLEKVDDIEERNEILSNAANSADIKSDVEDYLEEKMIRTEFERYKAIFIEAGWKVAKDDWFYYQDGYSMTNTKLDTIRLNDETSKLSDSEVKEIVCNIKGEVHFGLRYNCLNVRKYKEPKKNKNAEEAEKKKKAAETLKKKNRAALKEMRAQICDAYMDFILNSKAELKDPRDELGYFYTLLDICREGTSVTLYNLTPERVQYQLRDKLSLKGYDKAETNHFKDFENWTPLFQLLANMWWSFASSYDCFEDYECQPKKDLLSAHKSFCDVLHDLGGFHIRDEWKPILDGTSELYIKKEDKE